MTFKISSLILALACAVAGGAALAAVPAKEAAKLKSSLTPLGGERAGNKDGTIPAWAGGYTKVPADYKPGDPRPDFFAGEESIVSITAQNMSQYADKLTDGAKAMLKKYPEYRINVYPTHRTAAAPQRVYDNTFENATRANLTDNGRTVSGAYGGIPFPIPANAAEAIWNHRLSWVGESVVIPLRTWVVAANGTRSLASQGEDLMQFPYYYKDGNPDTMGGYFRLNRFVSSAPVSKAGEAILVHEPINASHSNEVWQYLVGQRRVRKAPSVAYDTPDFVTSGMGLFDEAWMMYGPVDRHEFKLIGKKELYVPYNNNRAALVKSDDLYKPNFLNPDVVRWELHRVWEIEANLLPGKRHVVPKRKYYLDEDTWQILMIDGWDAQGQLWRTNFTLTLLAPEIPALVGNVMWGGYNLLTGAYYLNATLNDLPQHYKARAPVSEGLWTADELANRGAR